MIDQLIGVLEDENAVLTAMFEFLADAKTGDGRLARTGRQHEKRVAVGGEPVTSSGHSRLLVVARNHVPALPQRAQNGAEELLAGAAWP